MTKVTVAALALGLAATAAACRPGPRGPGGAQASLRLAPPPPAPAFARALAPRAFRLPADHGPHEDYQTEWWYYTGHLRAGDGRRFGFQLTFFRRGLLPGPGPADDGLATRQLYLAHFALSDAAAGRQRFWERSARGAGGLAGASGEPFRVFLEDWSAGALDAEGGRLRLQARAEDVTLDLDLASTKPLVAHGQAGLSPKSAEPGNASYYLSYTRLAARGSLGLGASHQEVAGEAWFDHEWSTSALGPGAVGWDWFSLQLDERRELMFFRIRRQDGALEPVSGGTLVEPDGRTRRLAADDVGVEVLASWRSPETGADYPARWRLRVPSAQLELELTPLFAAQELRASFTYWEGAVDVLGTAAGRPLRGQGYVELTGYARTMRGAF